MAANDRGGLVATQECKEGARRRTGLAGAQQDGMLADWRMEFLRHDPGGSGFAAGKLGEGDKAEFGIAGGDELVGLGNALPLDEFRHQALGETEMTQHLQRRSAIGRDLRIGDGEPVERVRRQRLRSGDAIRFGGMKRQAADCVGEGGAGNAEPLGDRPFGMDFIGGQQQLMPELLAMVAPTVNSYTRLVPGFWAPTDSTVGIENRTCALRVIPGSAKSQRIEYRVAAADANPYIVLAAALASGLWGIEHRIEPQPMIEGNAYDHKFPEHLALPRTLWDAAQRLKQSRMAREYFGDAFVDHFAATREWEEREFRKQVTDWELARYFEII